MVVTGEMMVVFTVLLVAVAVVGFACSGVVAVVLLKVMVEMMVFEAVPLFMMVVMVVMLLVMARVVLMAAVGMMEMVVIVLVVLLKIVIG